MRIRSTKPEFWRSPDVSKHPLETRLLFLGLWNYVDDNGVGYDRVSNIAADLFADDLEDDPQGTLMRIHGGLMQLETGGQIVRYEGPDGRRYLFVKNWHHQKINRPSTPRKPLPCGEIRNPREDDMSTHGVLTEGSLPEQGTGNREQGTADVAPKPAATPASALTRFDDFWALYPKKVAKGAAVKAWARAVKKTDPDEIIEALRTQLPWFDQQVKPNGDFRPGAGPWLNAERWTDELDIHEQPTDSIWTQARRNAS